jgi:hypothetical protein
MLRPMTFRISSRRDLHLDRPSGLTVGVHRRPEQANPFSEDVEKRRASGPRESEGGESAATS